jgi:hypothetical protein
MKTAMQEAIDKVSFVRNMCNDENNEMDLVHTLETLKKDFIELLEKEKEQIIYDYMNGKYYHQYEDITAQEYYNQTYNN